MWRKTRKKCLLDCQIAVRTSSEESLDFHLEVDIAQQKSFLEIEKTHVERYFYRQSLQEDPTKIPFVHHLA